MLMLLSVQVGQSKDPQTMPSRKASAHAAEQISRGAGSQRERTHLDLQLADEPSKA